MKKKKLYSFSIFSCLAIVSCHAQSTVGIINIRDTSYSNASAYASSKKSNPEIKLVEEFQLATVKEKRDIAYCLQGERKLALDVFYPAKKEQKRAAIMII